MIKTKKQMYLVILGFVLVILLGTTTYAFFNYTRTGSSNVIKVGRITFNAEQDGTVTLSDLFPITVTGNVDASTPGVGSLSIHVTGDTTYEDGIEYLIKAVNVTDANGSNLPISISVGYEASEGQGKTIGEEDEEYFDNRGGNTSRYKVLSENTIREGQDIVVGYIAPGQTGIDGNLIIMAYLDAQNIAITDTNPEEETDTNNDGYIDGTTDTWVNGRTVFTTEEWNALQSSGVSFQVKVEANEGIWVEAPMKPAAEVIANIQTLETTPYGKVYTGDTPDNYVWFNNEQWRILGVYNDGVNGNMLKIVKNAPILTAQQFSNSSNPWDESLIYDYLENTYYSSLNIDSVKMIEEHAVWNIGSSNSNDDASTSYTSSTQTTWTGKIGMIGHYEYLYATENDGTCWTTAGKSFNAGCAEKNWLWPVISNNKSYDSWTMTPSSTSSDYYIIIFNNSGAVNNNIYLASNAVTPVVYLKSDVVITDGNGQIGETNSYKLSYNAN